MMFGPDIKLTSIPSLNLLNFSLTLIQSSSQLLIFVRFSSDHIFEPTRRSMVKFRDLILSILPIYIFLAWTLFLGHVSLI